MKVNGCNFDGRVKDSFSRQCMFCVWLISESSECYRPSKLDHIGINLIFITNKFHALPLSHKFHVLFVLLLFHQDTLSNAALFQAMKGRFFSDFGEFLRRNWNVKALCRILSNCSLMPWSRRCGSTPQLSLVDRSPVHHRDKQPVAPMANIESPINLSEWIWTLGISHSTQRKQTQQEPKQTVANTKSAGAARLK